MPKDTTFLLFDKSTEENTIGVLINQIDKVAINAKTTNLKAMVIFFFFSKLLSIFNTHKKKGG